MSISQEATTFILGETDRIKEIKRIPSSISLMKLLSVQVVFLKWKEKGKKQIQLIPVKEYLAHRHSASRDLWRLHVFSKRGWTVFAPFLLVLRIPVDELQLVGQSGHSKVVKRTICSTTWHSEVPRFTHTFTLAARIAESSQEMSPWEFQLKKEKC